MAITGTRSIKDMTAGQVAPETREWFRVTDRATVLAAVDAYQAWSAWDEYNSDQAAWNLANPDTEPPQEAPLAHPAAVADRDNVTVTESIFVELRFFATHTDPNERDLPVNIGWVQVKENVVTSAGFFADLLAVFNALRALTPYAP
jgi:hypothetical protein